MTEKIGIQSVFDNKDFNVGLNQYIDGLDAAIAQTTAAKDAMNTAASATTKAGAAAGAAAGPTGALGGLMGMLTGAMGGAGAEGQLLSAVLMGVATGGVSGLITLLPALISGLQNADLSLGGMANSYLDMVNKFAERLPGLGIAMKIQRDGVKGLAEEFLDLARKLPGVGAAVERIEQNFHRLRETVDRVKEAVAAAADWIKQKLEEAAQAALDFGEESLQIAGHVDELNRAAQVLGQQAGYSSAEINQLTADIIQEGIRADATAQLIAQLSRYNIDLAQATQFATIAQNAAVLVGRDSSDVLQSLTQAAVTNQVEVARSAGISANFGAAQETLADQLGVSRERLTGQQRTQANFNAIMQEGARILGVYDAAMGSPTKNLRSMERELYNIQAAIGAPFLDAWNNLIGIKRTFNQLLGEAVSEGGRLYPVLVNLGAVASIFTDALASLVNVGAAAVGVMGDEMTGEMNSLIGNAYTWGAELVANFAQGIVEATTTILVSALRYLGDVMTSWIAPHSPPRIIPRLDQYAIDTMNYYLRMMTRADFGILKNIQQPLRQVLAEDVFDRLSIDLSRIVTGGTAEPGFFNAILESAGMLGPALVDLTKAQLAYAAATEEANAAMEDYETSSEKVTSLTREYNDALRANASSEVLRGIRERLNAAELEQQAAEGRVSSTRDQLDALEEQAETQEEIVNQLIGLSDAEEEQRDRIGGLGGAGGPAGGVGGMDFGDLGMPELKSAGFDLATQMENAINEARARILAPFEDLRKQVATSMVLIGAEFSRILAIASEVFGGAGKKSDTFKLSLNTLVDFIFGETLPSFEDLQRFVEDNLNISLDDLNTFLDDIISALQSIGLVLGEELPPEMEGFRKEVLSPLTGAFKSMKDEIKGINDQINTFKTIAPGMGDAVPDMFRPGSPSPFEIALGGVNRELDGAIERLNNLSVEPRVTQTVTSAPFAAMRAANSYSVERNANFGDVNIYNQMTEENFKAAVRNVLFGEFGGGIS